MGKFNRSLGTLYSGWLNFWLPLILSNVITSAGLHDYDDGDDDCSADSLNWSADHDDITLSLSPLTSGFGQSSRLADWLVSLRPVDLTSSESYRASGAKGTCYPL